MPEIDLKIPALATLLNLSFQRESIEHHLFTGRYSSTAFLPVTRTTPRLEPQSRRCPNIIYGVLPLLARLKYYTTTINSDSYSWKSNIIRLCFLNIIGSHSALEWVGSCSRVNIELAEAPNPYLPANYTVTAANGCRRGKLTLDKSK